LLMRMEMASVISLATMTMTAYPTARTPIGPGPRMEPVTKAETRTNHLPIRSETKTVSVVEMPGKISPPSKIETASEAVSVTEQVPRAKGPEKAEVKAKQARREGKGTLSLYPPSGRKK
jgi:hypothetical protein